MIVVGACACACALFGAVFFVVSQGVFTLLSFFDEL